MEGSKLLIAVSRPLLDVEKMFVLWEPPPPPFRDELHQFPTTIALQFPTTALINGMRWTEGLAAEGKTARQRANVIRTNNGRGRGDGRD